MVGFLKMHTAPRSEGLLWGLVCAGGRGSGVTAPIRLVITTVVDVGPDNYPLPLTDRLTRCITGTAKAGEVNLSWQVLTHIPWTDKERGFVQHRDWGLPAGPPIRRPSTSWA